MTMPDIGYAASFNAETGAFEYTRPKRDLGHTYIIFTHKRGPSGAEPDYEVELKWLIARAKHDGVVLPMVRDAQRWKAWADASAEASGLQKPMEAVPLFGALVRCSGGAITRKFTADQLGLWVDQACKAGLISTNGGSPCHP